MLVHKFWNVSYAGWYLFGIPIFIRKVKIR
jgi:hypothetical protein